MSVFEQLAFLRLTGVYPIRIAHHVWSLIGVLCAVCDLISCAESDRYSP